MGVPNAVTGSDCLTTTFSYDDFGRLSQTTLPTGVIVTTSNIWLNQPDNLFYQLIHASGGAPDAYTYFDKYGRQTKTEKATLVSLGTKKHTKLTTYDVRGNIVTQSNSFFLGYETPRYTTFNFDAYNRPIEQTDYTGTSTITYTSLGNGVVKQSVVLPSGQSAETTTDACGKIISSKDNGGELFFTYNSQGKKIETKHGTTTIVTATFDDYGNQLTLNDVDAGTTTYSYDAYGRLYHQQDAKGDITSMQYDVLNRPVSKTIPEGTIAYTYYTQPLTTCRNNNPATITSYNGIVTSYKYDNATKNLLRVTQSGTSDGITHIINYTHNSYGDVETITYPSGVVIRNTYDANGYPIKKAASGAGLTSRVDMFYDPLIDGEGRYLSYTLGNGKVTTKSYSNEFPLSTSTPLIQQLSYDFQTNTGNLLERTDVLKNQTESFSYDNLNRLTGSVVNGITQFAISYDGNSSSSMGNILSKTDAGYYSYKTGKKHAVAYITQSPVNGQLAVIPAPVSAISTDEQNISHTSFSKMSAIEHGEGTYGGRVSLNIEYGADLERVMSYTTVGRQSTSRYFNGDYEEQTIGSAPPSSIHYVSGDGLNAMIVTENAVTSIYYLYTDYIGNLLTATNSSGTVVATQNFDAWGRYRNPNNWNQYGNWGLTQTWLYRGYTGHEMLEPFDLVNMNGRMYDPVQGRMLSPDNFVSSAYSTQAYNRFNYAHNNPLKFSDPDGNFPVAAVIIGAMIGGFMKGVQYDMSGKGSFFDGFWRGAIVGGIGGGLSAIGGGTFVANVAWGTGEGVLTNGISNLFDGEGFFKGAIGAGLIAGGIAAVSSTIESLKNLRDGYGFGTDDGRFNYLLREANDATAKNLKFPMPGGVNYSKAKRAAEFWNLRFGGPKVKFSPLGGYNSGRPMVDQFNEIDIPYNEIRFGPRNIRSTIAHERAHVFKTMIWENGRFIPDLSTVINTDIIPGHGTIGYFDAIRDASKFHTGFRILIDKINHTEWNKDAWKAFGWKKWLYQIPLR